MDFNYQGQMKKNIYIYDTTRGFFPFIKNFYAMKTNIVVCKIRSKICAEEISNSDICFFVVNDISDIAILKDIHCKIDHFFIGCTSNYLSKEVKELNLKKTTILDFNNYRKNDLLEIINLDLNLN